MHFSCASDSFRDSLGGQWHLRLYWTRTDVGKCPKTGEGIAGARGRERVRGTRTAPRRPGSPGALFPPGRAGLPGSR